MEILITIKTGKPRKKFLPIFRLVSLYILAGFVLNAQSADEIAPFKITEIKGHLSVDYDSDRNTDVVSGGSNSTVLRESLNEELTLGLDGYIYHPNFLKFNLGGGPEFFQTKFESDTDSNEVSTTEYNFKARLDFLEKKPYPTTLYYEKSHPSVVVGPAQRIEQETIEQGVKLSLRKPLLPALVNAEYSETTHEGQGFDFVVDDSIKRSNLRIYNSFGSSGHNQINYHVSDRVSRNASTGSTVQESRTELENVNWTTKLKFGDQSQFKFNNLIGISSQDLEISGSTSIKREDLRFSPYLNWQHNKVTSSFYRFNYFDVEQTGNNIRNQDLTMGVNQREQDGFTYSGDIQARENTSESFVLNTYGIAGQVKYLKPLTKGKLRMSASLRVVRNDQEASDTISSFQQFLGSELPINTWVALDQGLIDSATITVRNLTQGEDLIEDTHYRIRVIGSQTEILLTGIFTGITPIDANDIIRVSYDYDSGGTGVFTTTDQSYQLSYKFSRFYHAYARHFRSDQNVDSGLPTLAFNPVRTNIYGFQAEVPFRKDWSIGGEATYEDRDEVISPYLRNSYEAFLQIPFPWQGNIRFTAKSTDIDNRNSTEDVDSRGYNIRLQSRLWLRTRLFVDSDYEKDTGGSSIRERWFQRAGLQWRFRQLRLKASAQRLEELLDGSGVRRHFFDVTLRRDF